MTAENDEERLLSILHAHGQQFLSAFDIPVTLNVEKEVSKGPESEDEWTGIGSSPDESTSKTASGDDPNGGFEQEDDDFTAGSLQTQGVMIVSPTWKRPAFSLTTRELRKSFMSSKVSNVTSSVQPVSEEKTSNREPNDEDERSNTQNDALLHRLVHTTLLSGSLNPEVVPSHAQRNQALAGRVLELTGKAKLGKGESILRQGQRNTAAKHIRDGLIRKQREQGEKALEEAKNLGNYHPTLKRLYDSNLSSTPKKRARGLRMGIGKFAGGTLKLSREEVASVTGSGNRLRDDGRWGTRSRPRQKKTSKY